MRQLSETLLAAQQDPSSLPCIIVKAVNKTAGVTCLHWERLYEGSEDDYYHALTIAGDGSMIRARIGLPVDNRRLYIQRIPGPDEQSDFSSWVYTGQYNCIAVTALTTSSEVLVFFITSSRFIYQLRSTDNGETWDSPQIIGSSITPYVYGFAAACKPDDDIAIFVCTQAMLYVAKRTGGAWNSSTAWDKTTGDLSGVAASYGNDWNLVVTGKDSDGNFRVWNLVYGDGGDVSAGAWSDLRDIAASPSDGDYSFQNPSMDSPDVFRCCYVEKFTGVEAYSRPFLSQTLPDVSYSSNLWLEPVPFNFFGEYGLAFAHFGDYCWLSCSRGVWRSELAEENEDLSESVITVRQETDPERDRLILELANDDGRFSSLPAPLAEGCRLDLSPGYLTSAGREYSDGQSYTLEALEYVSRQGISKLVLYGKGGRDRVNRWNAGSQFRFNRSTDEMNVLQILEFILARAGLKLEVISQSSVVTGFYPDFIIHAGSSGSFLVKRLLSFVPDELFIEGDIAYLLNPLPSDNSVYSYGLDHIIFEGRYRTGSMETNRVTVEGYDENTGQKVVKDSTDWEHMTVGRMRVERIEDSNLGSVSEAEDRGEAILKKAGLGSTGGLIEVPVNCGQQLFDVIDITDKNTGLDEEKKRIMAITLVYDTARGNYRQMLTLGGL